MLFAPRAWGLVISILVVDDTRLYREGLAHTLAQELDFGPVETATDLMETRLRLQDKQQIPDVILFHVAQGEQMDLLRALTSTVEHSKVVAMGVSENEDEILACAEAGAAGYITRGESLVDLIQTVHSVARGETRCSPRIAASLLKRVAQLASERDTKSFGADLTPREREIAALIDQGLSNKEIASRLSIAVRTVKNHVHHILEKLNVHRRGEATARLRASWLVPSRAMRTSAVRS